MADNDKQGSRRRTAAERRADEQAEQAAETQAAETARDEGGPEPAADPPEANDPQPAEGGEDGEGEGGEGGAAAVQSPPEQPVPRELLVRHPEMLGCDGPTAAGVLSEAPDPITVSDAKELVQHFLGSEVKNEEEQPA